MVVMCCLPRDRRACIGSFLEGVVGGWCQEPGAGAPPGIAESGAPVCAGCDQLAGGESTESIRYTVALAVS